MGAQSIDTRDLATVDQVLDRAAAINADVEAYVEPATQDRPRRSITFAEWAERADRAAVLFDRHGVSANDVVCLVMSPSIEFAVAFQGLLRVGAIASGINPRMGPSERDSIFERIDPVLTLVDDELVDSCAGIGSPLLPRTALRELPPAGTTVRVTRTSSDPVAVVWTSGTTGLPKGALFDHDSLRAVAQGTDVLSQPGDRRLSPLPFSHVSYVTRAWDEIAHGVTTVIAPSPWRAQSALETMVAERVSVAQGVPTQWALLLERPELDHADLSSLRVAGTGAARMAPSQVAAVRERFGVPVVVRYTSTETSLGTGTRPGDPDEVVATTVGRPVAGVEIDLVDADGKSVATGEVGRVRLRSAAAMRGYVSSRRGIDPGAPPPIDLAATARVLGEDGWVTTGDFGMLDASGNLTLVGRDNEMYQRGGYNVYPAEVEQALDGHAALASVAVVAGEDPVLGEIGVAFVVLKDDAAPPALDELVTVVRGQLADYKAPDALVVLDELPVTAMGKVDKRALRPLADQAAVARSAQLAARRADRRLMPTLGKDDPNSSNKED